MLETILHLLIGWFLISIPASLIIGFFLSMSKHPTEKSPEAEANINKHHERASPVNIHTKTISD